jgi:hypothetical protein
LGGILGGQPVVQAAGDSLFGKKFRHFHDMETFLRPHEIDIIKIKEAHFIVLLLVVLVFMIQSHQIQVLLWGHH